MNETPACPLCHADRIGRDYPPVRGYVLALVGLALVFIARVINPQLLQAGIIPALHKFLWIGMALFVYGAYHLFIHGNRYCLNCGHRFRAVRGKELPWPPLRETSSEQPAAGNRDIGTTGITRRHEEKLNPQTPVEPILACLRFKDVRQREAAAETLRKLTGQSFGPDAEAWEAWWSANKEAYKAERKGKS
jgi:hypothetical protein